MPQVSVIIPNFNHARYLTERIESVLNQTFNDFEVIILDDCSADNSKEIIESYRNHPKIAAIVYNEKNSGSTFKQWNKGITLSNGKYIWIAESDDAATPHFLENMMHLYLECSDVGLAYCQSYRTDEKSTVTGDWSDHTELSLQSSLWNNRFCLKGTEAVENYLGYINILPNASAILINKESYVKAGGARENFRLNGDWLLYIRIAMEGYSIAYSPEKNNYFREHSSKVTRTAVRKGINVTEAYRILQYIVDHKNISVQAKTALINFYQKNYLPTILNRSVNAAALISCLLIALRLSFTSTLKILAARLLTGVIK